MSKPCPTVKIKFANEQGFALLDEVAFDPKVHELFVEPSAPQTEPAPAKPPKAKAKPVS